MITVTTKGYFKVIVNNVEVSKHTQDYKAIERALNEVTANPSATVYIQYPERMVVENDNIVEDTTPPSTVTLISVQ